MSAAIIAILVGGTGWLLLPDEADPHDYVRKPDDVVIGDGSLAAVLERYRVSLPDQATDVHFHDNESLIGSEGTLFLHFEMPHAGLTPFLQTLKVGRLTPGLPAGWDLGGEGQRFGWSFRGSSWRGAQRRAEGTVTYSVAVGQAAKVDSVYVIAEYP
ncbi:hypothetical protein ABZ865_41205 [Streptomyces sp. NPDC047085]|uniref:hypothetical protein n=1 Tax=Streptomyces sp. NPDC047085 TaxID=3155140 RepID=UPI0033EB076C